MMQWFIVDKASNLIRGWHRSSTATTLPADTATETFVEATDADIAQYSALQAQSLAEGRDGAVELVNGTLQLPADTRPLFRLSADQTSFALGGSCTVTVTALNPDGTTNTALNGPMIMPTADGRKWRLEFVSGVATKVFTPQQSGDYNVRSMPGYKVEAPLHIEVFE